MAVRTPKDRKKAGNGFATAVVYALSATPWLLTGRFSAFNLLKLLGNWV